MKEFVKYFIVGTFAALLDFFTFSFLTVGLDIHYLIANVISTCLALIFSYYFTCTLVFRQKKINARRDFLPFAVIGFIGLGLQNIMLYALIDLKLAFEAVKLIVWVTNVPIDTPAYVQPLSKIFVIGVIFLWNFFMRKYLVFKRAEQQEIIRCQEQE
ncbi:MAG: GtrA family protein [Planctomycetaceae bacterium]|jgi:putative flippase GtrA|nr:GtrA family protein [Planctomycetaceae bacterium]